ncbi:DoxX family protein [soil metagenome]
MTKAHKIIYWVSTLWLALGMTSTGIVQLMKLKDDVDRMTHLGYPVYLLTMLGVWKLLGVVAVLIPRYPVLKEWAYAGFFFAMSGAAISHIIMSDPISELAPSLLLLVLTVLSWYFRPASRRVLSMESIS